MPRVKSKSSRQCTTSLGSTFLCDSSSPTSHTSSFPPSHPGRSRYTTLPAAVSLSSFMPPLKRHLTARSTPSRPPSQRCTSLTHSPLLLPLPTAPRFLKLSGLLAYAFVICLLPPASKIPEDGILSVFFTALSQHLESCLIHWGFKKKSQCFCN